MTRVLGLAYAGYLVWLVAGAADYHCHRRGGLAATSGLREWVLHFVQVGVIGSGLALGLLFQPALGVYAAIGATAIVHALLGYADTTLAFRYRPVRPFEQHVHSVLDSAPWVAGTWYVVATWDGAAAWTWTLRDPPLPLAWWAAVAVPAAVLVVAPMLRELADVMRWRRGLPAAS